MAGSVSQRIDGDVVLGGGDVLAQGSQPGRQAVGVGAHQLVQAAVDQAAAALAGMGVVGVAAGGAVAPGRGCGAVGAERVGHGAGDDRLVAAAG